MVGLPSRYPFPIVPGFPQRRPFVSREERVDREADDPRFGEERERREAWHPLEGIARERYETEHPYRPMPPVTPPRARL